MGRPEPAPGELKPLLCNSAAAGSPAAPQSYFYDFFLWQYFQYLLCSGCPCRVQQ